MRENAWLLALALAVAGCGAHHDPDPQAVPRLQSTRTSAPAILARHCGGCHNPADGDAKGGGIFGMTDPDALAGAGLVVPGNAEASPLFRAVLRAAEGKAPFPPLAPEETETIRGWIDGLAEKKRGNAFRHRPPRLRSRLIARRNRRR